MKKSRGFTLLEMMLVIGLAASATLLNFYSQQAELEQKMAGSVGGELAQYNNAVRNFLAKNLNAGNFTRSGSAWLKNTSCGGTLAIGAEYLPCSFPSATVGDPISFGNLSLTTTVVSTGTAPNSTVTATTLTTPFTLPRSGSPAVRSDLAGLAAITASAGYLPGSAGAGFSATTDGSFQSNPANGIITMTASNNANQDIWLRTDGGNKMHAALQFDSADPLGRQIIGASRIQNLAAQTLFVGVASGSSPITASAVVLDSNTEIIGSLRVRSALTVDGGAAVTGNISATGSVNAGGNVTASGSMSAGGSVSAAGNVNASAVVAQIFYDSNNTGYYLDPTGWANLNAIQANYISSTGRVRAGEFIQVDGVATENWGCSPTGLQGRDSEGAALSCVNGIWKKPGSSVFQGTWNFGTFDKKCHVANPFTGGCSCPAGAYTYLTGQAYRYNQWDETMYICYSNP